MKRPAGINTNFIPIELVMVTGRPIFLAAATWLLVGFQAYLGAPDAKQIHPSAKDKTQTTTGNFFMIASPPLPITG
jgi:hypothetical protein